MFDSQVMLLGEITFKSLLGVKGVIQKLQSPNWPSPTTNVQVRTPASTKDSFFFHNIIFWNEVLQYD